MEGVWQDLRYAARTLLRAPGFTAVAVLTLALGIGANATMFGVLDALFLSPPPGVHEPDRVQRIYIVRDEGTMSTPEGGAGSYPDYRDLRAGTRAFTGIAGQLPSGAMSLGRGEAAREVTGMRVTGGYFPTLAVRPTLGRFFGPAEDSVPGASPVAVISHAFWQSSFGGDADVIGREVFLEGDVYTIIGVAPENFHGIDNEPVDVWVPTAMDSWEEFLSSRGFSGLELFGRLAPGVPPERAASEAAAALRHASETAALPEWLQPDPTPGVFLGPTNEALGPKRAEPATVALWLALVTGIVLLIACANVANLLLARATGRRREIAVRTAIGAGRTRLLRQLFTESLLLALLGGIAGLLLTLWSTGLIRLFPLPPLASVINGRMLLFVLGATVLTGVLFGLIPALHSSKTNLAGALRDGTAGAGRARSRTRTALLVAQVALSFILLIGAGLLVRSLAKAQSVELGIDADHLLYVSVDLGDVGYSDAAQDAFRERAVERLRTLPGVAGVSTAYFPPLSGSGMSIGEISMPGRESLPKAQEGPYTVPVGPDYFQTTGTPLLRGRAFTKADREGSPPVMLVNETMAALYWPDGSAVGACLTIGDGDETGPPPCTEVVGVTQDIRHRPLELAPPKYYVPLAQTKSSGRVIILRTRGEPQAMVEQVRSVVQNLAPGLPFVSVTPATEKVAPALRPFRLGAMLFSLFGVLALLLAAIGLYGVVAFTVAQQTREIGVRIALGAATGDVLRLVIVRTMVFVLLGVAIGMAGALGVTRFMEGLLYGVETLDAPTFVAVPLLLLAVALLAAYLPARRATRVDPMVALRAE